MVDGRTRRTRQDADYRDDAAQAPQALPERGRRHAGRCRQRG